MIEKLLINKIEIITAAIVHVNPSKEE